MENSFKDERTGVTIYAPLGATLIHATMRPCDLIPAFLEAIRDTAEYAQIMLDIANNWNLSVIADAGASDNDERWDSEDISWFLNEELWEIMNNYAPEGYYFGAIEGDGSDYGYWSEKYVDAGAVASKQIMENITQELISVVDETFKKDDIHSAPREVLENLILRLYDGLHRMNGTYPDWWDREN